MKNKGRIIRNIILFIFLIILTFYIIFKDQDFTEMINLLRNVNQTYILIAITFMFIYVTCEAINIGRTLKALNEKSSFWKNVKYALIGFFFSGVTPAASGGQPMEIYYMHKDGITVANSTLALLINLSSMQIVTISMALISVVLNYKYLNAALIGFFILGIGLNASALTLLLLAIFSKKSLQKMIDFIVKVMRKLKIKKADSIAEKLNNEVDKYQSSSNYIKENKKLIIKTIITTYIQFIAFFSVTYWVYRSFGLSGYNLLQVTTLQSILFATVSGIPSPGAVGVSEGGFIEIFKHVVPIHMINSLMLLTRGINFYLLIIVSGFVTIVNIFKSKKLKKEE